MSFSLANQDFSQLTKFSKNRKIDVFSRTLIPLDDKASKERKEDALNSSLNVFRFIDPNNFENRLDRAERSRKAFEESIDRPVEYIKKKNAARREFMDACRDLRSFLYGQFFKAGVSAAVSEKLSSDVAKELSDVLMKVLDEEIYPSKLEEDIYRSRVVKVESKLKSPLKSAVEKKYSKDKFEVNK
jgi:hypothetical protein